MKNKEAMGEKKKLLIVFIGKPGVGKSTLINSLFPNWKVVDVLPFVKKYKEKTKIPEEKTILGYQDMYKHISFFDISRDLILELGTNHPELNVAELKNLEKKFILKIFLCDAPDNVCYERAQKRGRKINKEALMLRIKRDFPNSHLQFLNKKKINYNLLDMTRSLKENKTAVEKLTGKAVLK